MRRHTLFAAVVLVVLPFSAPAMQSQGSATGKLLSELIRIDTSNPPGHEGLVAEFLAPRFRELGFQVDIVPTPEAGKAFLRAAQRRRQ